MTSCRSRKTGNCSDWPKKTCHKRLLKLRGGFFYSRIACLMRRRWGVASTVATLKLRRGTEAVNYFFGLCMLRLSG